MIVGPVLPAKGATRCQISSVMNGINGWARRRMPSKTRTKVCRVPRCRAASSLCRLTFAASKYQSQYSFQTNS